MSRTGWTTDFRAEMRKAALAPRIAATKGMRLTGEGLKRAIREQVTGAGLGQRVAKTVREVTYPKGATGSLRPASTVFFKAPHIIRAFEDGATIRPVGGAAYLAIPTKECPYGRGGGHIRPKEAIRRFREFRYQRAESGALLMLFKVAYSQDKLNWKRATRARNRNQRRRSGLLVKPRAAQWVAMFILVRQARLPKRLDLAGALRTAGSRLNANIAASWPRDIEAL